MEQMEIEDFPKSKVSLNQPQTKTRYERKVQSVQGFMKLIKQNPMSDAIIEEVDKRQIRVKDKWLTDFASCNYLGFDVHPEVMEYATNDIQKLSTYPGQSRLLGSPYLYEQLEEIIKELTGAPDCIILPSITLTHLFALPILAQEGDLFLDKRAHKTIYDGCVRATHYGANMVSFAHNDCDDLEKKLQQSTAKKKMICVDGVYSMHGYTAAVPKMLELAEKYDATLYIDDAHGFGVLGERAEDEKSPYGKKGNGTIRFYDLPYDRVIMIGSLSKAYSSLLGFMTCKPEEKKFLKCAIDPYLYSGPAPISALSCLIKSFEINERSGDDIRAHLHSLCKQLEDAVDELGYRNDNQTGFPVYRLTMEDADKVDFVGQFLYENGIYVTLAPYPLVPKHEAGFRIQLTAANTKQEVDHLIDTLQKLEKYAKIQRYNSAPEVTIKKLNTQYAHDTNEMAPANQRR